MIQMLQLGQGQKVLDIGAGPGTHTIPMAKIVGQVTAIEPSPGMADVLEHNLAEENIRNVNCVRKRWEDVVPSDLYSPYDIVLASLSLGMLDIRAALEKMDRACSGRVYLVWPAGVTAWERIYREAWPQIHAEPYVSGPKADVLFNVLYQMGICPDIHIYRDEHVEMFSGLDEAVAYYRSMYCATTQEKESSLRRFLGRKLNRSTDGLTLRGVSQMALLSWDVMINRMQG
jgi:SAM-dependent methyltransferase